MKSKTIVAASGMFFLAPVLTFLYLAIELIEAFNAASKLGAHERPAALANGIQSIPPVHYFGILGYYLGIAMLVYCWKSGLRKEAGILWVMAVSTVILVWYKNVFLIGVITALVLIWKRRQFRPTSIGVNSGPP